MCQIFDFGNTDIEKRSIFFRLLEPLLTFGRDREGVDLSALRLTAYTIKDLGRQKLSLGNDGDSPKIDPLQAVGSGQVRDKEKVQLEELIAKVNDLFEGDLTPGDKLVYVNNAIRGKLMENQDLMNQAANNSKEQFAASPDLDRHIESAIIDSMDAFATMSKQALVPKNKSAIKDVLLGPAGLYEALVQAYMAGKSAGGSHLTQ